MQLFTQSKAIIHFIQKMDIEMIDAFLDDNLTYQNFEKCIFISKLQNVFDQFKNAGDTELIMHEGMCGDCNKGCKVYSFIGNVSNNYMDLFIQTDEGKITDMYECAACKNDKPVLKKERVHIHIYVPTKYFD